MPRVSGWIRSEQLDPRQLAHALIEGCGEVATVPGMFGDQQAVGESAGARFEQAQRTRDDVPILECERNGNRFFLREFFVLREDDQCTTPE